MAKVESFELDHDAVKAPYVRLAGREEGAKGDVITKFDIRLTQPNQEAVPTAALHTIEHMSAGLVRDYVDGVIDLSPMGCRTGFYLLVWGEKTPEEIAIAFTKVLRDIVDSSWDDVQGVERKGCGNYKDHSLFGAQEWAKHILDQGFSKDPFERQVVEVAE
ncbi:S-ribosylhomocysteine lyase [Aerococcus sanguinicola]|uniref:S-ribosylhomocysteine lyase n=1 Tax=unclassified Aerococcus TaxID=2618060 RepID=UPI0008A3EB65|nr:MULTISPECIES: S-ribosylhomocysteine lyase [unclassified Aerococcus]KAB0647988.1 S-ribosylhomocysteine lyase [Aerococcus sanguinicola]MDK6233492.1 S-ribosylhomocysteine lyase [Aerococcus sp. UMB10185]MDK6805402.1 S-ribosylhomocysteine lyase [Aerococcus sp. UMB7834]MDK6855525.1 S-ribosylhomocysteine lyase [Aerococcus sp. UMB7533]MDK8502245.1 S-ribosylhomocysteine lyase [Aerococcus sp. UMB1112A]